MIKTISFDLGGVLFTEGKKVALKKLSNEFHYDQKLILDLLRSPKSIDLRKGIIEGEDFWTWMQEQLPVDYDVKTIKSIWYESYILDQNVLDLLKQLKENYQIVAFSGNIKDRIDYLEQKYGFRKYFDKEIYSFDYGFDKEAEDAVKHLLSATEHIVDEIVHIDDVEKVADHLRKVGLNTILYHGNIDELKNQLRDQGVILD